MKKIRACQRTGSQRRKQTGHTALRLRNFFGGLKKIGLLLLTVCLLLPMTGCWNYRGLNELTIVAGVAIDKIENQYLLSFEIMDMSKPVKQEGVTSRMIQAEGKSIFDAIRNAKNQLASTLYFGNVQIVVISQEIAREDGLHTIMDFFLRDPEMRETIRVVIPQQPQAWEILDVKQKDGSAVAYGIVQIIRDNSKTVGATIDKPLYLMYQELYTPGSSLTLPAFHVGSSDPMNPSFAEANGTAVFQGDKLAGFLSSSETKYLLLGRNELKGGLLTMYLPDIAPHNLSLEISRTSCKLSHREVDGKLTIRMEVYVEAFLADYPHKKMRDTQMVIDPIQNGAEELIQESMADLIQKTQTKYHADIIGFGDYIYRHDLALWNQIQDDWDTRYRDLSVEIVPTVHILNSAMLYQE